MLTKYKITTLVTIQIFLIISSFLLLSYFENEQKIFENTINNSVKIRQMSDALIFDTEKYLSGIPYATPHLLNEQILSEMKIIRYGGTIGEDILKPLSPKFISAHSTSEEKLTNYIFHIDQILQNGSLEIDYSNQEFVILDTEKFDANGSLDYLISILNSESQKQSNNLILLGIGLAILNVGIHIFMILIILDIIRKESEKTIRLEKLAAIGELGARLVHDLRNPLNVISLTVDLLKLKINPQNDNTANERFSLISNAISRMSHQLEDVMDFVRTSELKLENSSMLDIIKFAINRNFIPKSVTIEMPDQDYFLKCDKIKLGIVFVNLISNSLDAINNQGSIKIRFNKNPTHVDIEIEDSGPGIKKDQINKIFDPLFTTKEKGTGLGLSSCKNIIEQHMGTITVTNYPTIFSIRLPNNP